jgi:hypothetical protein
MIITNDRYSMSETEQSMYAIQMVLIIQKSQKSDMGGYKCISKNSIGDAEGTIRLYGKFEFIGLIYINVNNIRVICTEKESLSLK